MFTSLKHRNGEVRANKGFGWYSALGSESGTLWVTQTSKLAGWEGEYCTFELGLKSAHVLLLPATVVLLVAVLGGGGGLVGARTRLASAKRRPCSSSTVASKTFADDVVRYGGTTSGPRMHQAEEHDEFFSEMAVSTIDNITAQQASQRELTFVTFEQNQLHVHIIIGWSGFQATKRKKHESSEIQHTMQAQRPCLVVPLPDLSGILGDFKTNRWLIWISRLILFLGRWSNWSFS